MRNFFFLLCIAISTQLCAQNNTLIVSFRGIGSFKPGMTKAEVEKVIGKKITLKNLLMDEGGSMDTISTSYKNATFIFYFEKQFTDSVNYVIDLYGIQTSSPLCKTADGIGIGTDKMKIITAYEMNGINIWPVYEGEDYSIKSKIKAIITVTSDEGENAIIFHMVNKKVASIEVSYSYGD